MPPQNMTKVPPHSALSAKSRLETQHNSAVFTRKWWRVCGFARPVTEGGGDDARSFGVAPLLGWRFRPGRRSRSVDPPFVTKRVSSLDGHPLTWHELFAALPGGVAIVDADGIVRYLNDDLRALTGFEGDSLIGQRVEVLVPVALREPHVFHRFSFVVSPHRRSMNGLAGVVLVRKDGIELPVNIGLSPLAVAGEVWAIVAVQDISAQRRLE
jgi:PAS domain S-box-containing protein